ncbi:MAG: hypothetical protein CSA42_03505 [Gammaproteobacteria bacterium]|nr:MAG: hypothetical protein CSA42_03505 [Gammaproteobacteria bacterium]
MRKQNIHISTKNIMAAIMCSCLALSACSANYTTIANNSKLLSVKTDKHPIHATFVNKDKASSLLATHDAYINRLSTFDWQSKFKSEQALTATQLKAYYAKATLDWTDEYTKKVQIAIDILQNKTADLNLNLPTNIKFILSNGLVEADSAYTRQDYIVLPTEYLKSTQAFINHVIAHEFFHIYSRYNYKHREQLYAIVGYQKIPEVELPKIVADNVITNPDAPNINYAITLSHKGNEQTFVPILYSKVPYDINNDALPFLFFMNEAFLPINVIQEKTKVDSNYHPLFVDKKDTNFDEIAKPNSHYLNHPEEMLAEHFAMWVIDDDKIKHQQPINELIDTMRSIK